MIVIALFSYESTDDDEITIKRGDKVSLIEKYDDGWCLVKRGDNTGLVPSNYLDSDADKKQQKSTVSECEHFFF